MENEIEQESTQWIILEDPGSQQIRQDFIEAAGKGEPEKFDLLCQWAMHARRDASGLNAFDRFVRAGTRDWNNDQRLILNGRTKMQARLLERKHPIDELQTEVTDGLDPAAGSFLVCDRSFARHFARSAHFLATTYTLPHFVRIVGTAIPLDVSGNQLPLEKLRSAVRDHGGPTDLPGMARWIFDHMIQMVAALCLRK